MEAYDLQAQVPLSEKPVSGAVKITTVSMLGFAANDPNVHQGCSECSYDCTSDAIVYNRHRYYDPETAQYLSPDPIGLQGGLTPQAYVHNPTGWVDPLGLCPCAKNKKTTYDGESRRDALRQAKRDAGIENAQAPKVERVDLLDGGGKKILDKNGLPVQAREYHYTNKNGVPVVIQEHSLGHTKATAGHGLEPHFNVRKVDPVTGGVLNTSNFTGTHGHYNF